MKTVTILFLGIALIAGSSQAQGNVNNERDIIADVGKLFENIEKVVGDAISDAVQVITGLMQVITKLGVNIEENIKNVLVNATQPFLNAINELGVKAGEAGIDIVICVGDSEKQISELPNQLMVGVTDCVAKKLDEARAILNHTINDIESTMDVVLAIGDDIETCEKKGDLQIFTCLAGVSLNITIEVVQLPLKISKDIASAKLYVDTLPPLLTACGANKVVDLGVQAGAIVANVTTCVNNLLNN